MLFANRRIGSTRKTLYCFVALSLILGACVASSAENAKPDTSAESGRQAPGVDWPRFLGPAGDGKSPEKGIATDWEKTPLKIVWRRKLGVGYGGPVIAKGKLYQFSRFGEQARLTCMSSKTGAEIWKFEYPTEYVDMLDYNNGPRCSPVVDGDRVYIHGVEGKLHCLNALTGKLVWKVDTVKDFGVVQNFFGVGSTPLVEGDLLIVNVGGSPPESQGVGFLLDQVKPNGSGIVAFDKLTGKVRYKLTDELAGYASPTAATINGRRWCFVFARGGLVAFEPKSGKLDFHFPWRARVLESVNASNPVVVGDKVFISETYGPGGALLRVKPGGYDVIWTDEEKRRDKSMQCHWNTAIHHQGYLYGCSGRHSNNAELRCVEFDTGKVMWSVPGLSRCSLTFVDGHFICLAEYGELILFKANPKHFEKVSQLTLTEKQIGPQLPGFGPPRVLEYPAWAAPVVSHGLLYVRGKDNLACLELMPEK